ncbi:MAG: hypothetical protein ACM3TR_09850 [Caulobacteraceae bacterium]
MLTKFWNLINGSVVPMSLYSPKDVAGDVDEDETDEKEEEETEEEEEEKEIEEEPETEEESEEEKPDEEEKPKKPKDKVTAAVIKEKQKNKALRDKIAELEREKREREADAQYSKKRQRLIDNQGYTEEEADERIREMRRIDRLEAELRRDKYERQAEKLESRYPDLPDRLDEFIDIIEASNGKITMAELCKAKLDESSEYDIRTKTEQETMLRKKNADSKKIDKGDTKEEKVVRLSPDDERVFKNMNEKRRRAGKPLLTKAQFLDYLHD